MKLYLPAVLIAALAAPAFCQEPSPDPMPDPAPQGLSLDALTAQAQDALTAQADRMEVESQKLAEQAARMTAQFDSSQIADMADKASKAAEKFYLNPGFDLDLSQLKMQLDSTDFSDMKVAAEDLANQVRDNMAFFQAPVAPVPPVPPMPKVMIQRDRMERGDGAYDSGTRALDQHKYDEAILHFNDVINAKSPRADGALYWKAYALNREGKRDEALAALTQLSRDYPSTAWLHDAQALQAEVKQNAGQPVSPAQETNDDLKLMAINSLMNADAERAIPLVEGILKGNSAPNVKDRALFVLAQNKSPRAQQALLDYAKGGGNPDLQLRAIQYVGMSGTKEAQQQLVGIYSASTDARAKSAILQALMMSRANDALMNIAKSEKDASLRDTAIRTLASNKGVPVEGLVELYGASDAQAKKEIVNGLAARGDAKTLVDLARKETDPAMKRMIVERLGMMHDNKDAMDYMMELLK
jgi:TolA-binding protein